MVGYKFSMLKIVSVIIINKKGEILLLKRSTRRKSYPGKWNFISGKIENERPVKCAEREIAEELGNKAEVKLIKAGKPFIDKQKEGVWQVYPFVYQFVGGKIKINNEHSEYKWIARNKINTYDIVPGALEDIKRVKL